MKIYLTQAEMFTDLTCTKFWSCYVVCQRSSSLSVPGIYSEVNERLQNETHPYFQAEVGSLFLISC